MRGAFLNVLRFGVGGAVATVVAFLVFVPRVSYGSEGTDPADGVGALAIVLNGFAWPVVLNVDWWVSVALLGLAFSLAHRRGVHGTADGRGR